MAIGDKRAAALSDVQKSGRRKKVNHLSSKKRSTKRGVRIKGLRKEPKVEHIAAVCAKFGKLSSVRVTGKSAFVVFERQIDAKKAVKFVNSNGIDGDWIQADLYKNFNEKVRGQRNSCCDNICACFMLTLTFVALFAVVFGSRFVYQMLFNSNS